MILKYLTFAPLFLFCGFVLCDEPKIFKVSAADSYLDAYQQSHSEIVKGLDKLVKKSDREFVENSPGYPPYSPPPQNEYGPPLTDSYGPPASGPPSPQYGPPAPQYGPPAPQYGPPVPQYGPPAPQYGPPPASSVQVFYGMPHAMLSIWDKLKWKLDLFTIGKILLKLVIFKKIVSLIAILCLLLFIPSLKHKKLHHGSSGSSSSEMMGEDEEDEMLMRGFKNKAFNGEAALNNISTFVLEAIENYGDSSRKRKSLKNCDSIYCKSEKIAKKLNKKLTYKKLAKELL